jgi:hypothetical protein
MMRQYCYIAPRWSQTSRTQVILLPQFTKSLGLQVHATTPGSNFLSLLGLIDKNIKDVIHKLVGQTGQAVESTISK